MPFIIKSTLKAIESHLAASGYAVKTQIGEPKAPPSESVSAAIFMSDVSVVAITAGGTTIERHTVTVRLYKRMLEEPQENIEIELAEAVSKIMAALVGEYDLGSTIRNVDVGGQHGGPLSAKWGYVDVGGVIFRVADIAVGLIVDDSATAAP